VQNPHIHSPNVNVIHPNVHHNIHPNVIHPNNVLHHNIHPNAVHPNQANVIQHDPTHTVNNYVQGAHLTERGWNVDVNPQVNVNSGGGQPTTVR
jgi:hypothetical protein